MGTSAALALDGRGGYSDGEGEVMRATVYAQQTNADGRTQVYRVPFQSTARARAYVQGALRPVRAVVVAGKSGLVECYDDGRIVSRESR